MRDVDQEVQAMFGKMVAELERDSMRREQPAAEVDPRKHRLSRVFGGSHGLSYHWLTGGKDRKRRLVLFCWSVHRNVAGYFLTWRQLRQHNGITKRDRWAARKTRRGVIAIAQRRANAMKGATD